MAGRFRCRVSDKFGAELVVEAPDHTAFVIRFAAVLDHEDECFGHFCLYEQADTAIRDVRDETILRSCARIVNDAAGTIHDLTR